MNKLAEQRTRVVEQSWKIEENGFVMEGEWNYFSTCEEAEKFLFADYFQGNKLLNSYSLVSVSQVITRRFYE